MRTHIGTHIVPDFSQILHKAAAEMYLPRQGKPDIKGNDLVRMDTVGGALADYLAPMTAGGYRAGKSEVMAKSIGRKVDPRVKAPGRTSVVDALKGSLSGASIGSILGAVGGGVKDYMEDGSLDYDQNVTLGAGYGAIGGFGVGALAGDILSAIKRRRAMRETNKAFDEAESVKPFARRGHPLAILGGGHEAGRAEGLGVMTGGQEERPLSVDMATGFQYVPYVGGPVSTGASILSKMSGRSKTKDLVSQALGYAPGGMGVSDRNAKIQSTAPAFQ